MAVCWFDSQQKYNCEYRIEEDCIRVDVEYDISFEIEYVNGVRTWGDDTHFERRDILIADSAANKAFLLKNAYYSGLNSSANLFESRTITRFSASTYFATAYINYSRLTQLLPTPKVKRIKIYSSDINKYIGHLSVKSTESRDECVLALSKVKPLKTIEVMQNNIKTVSLGDTWRYKHSITSISIEMSGYLELELFRRVNYSDVHEYIYETIIFMQLFCPGKFRIERLAVDVEGVEYDFSTAFRKPEYTDKHIEPSVKLSLLDFLKECYSKIPYRKGKNEIRNIPYVVVNTSRSLEDNFLMLYRFIECYYKRRGIKNFMNECLKNRYKETNKLTEQQVENYAQEIICLRNNYVHSGYYIKNGSLKVRFDKRKRDPRDYTVNINSEWIFEKNKMLYSMVLNIIFVDMLGMKEYNYKGLL